VAERGNTNAVTGRYLRGNGRLIGILNSSSTMQYYLHNGHGDVTGLTSAAGTVTKTYAYDAFGNERNKVANDPNPFRYAGEYFDNETGSVYLRARYYSPITGRFATEDPVRDGANWYAYCGNNPISLVDPSGLVYIPVRSIIEGLGGTVTWNSLNNTATASLDGNTVSLWNGDANGNYIGKSDGKMYSDDAWLFGMLAATIDLGKGWSGRVDRNASGGDYRRHVHVEKGDESYSQNEDGSPHDGSTGSPPNKVKEQLKKKMRWDWDGNEKKWNDDIEVLLNEGDTYSIYYPNGRVVTVKPYWQLYYYRPSIRELREYSFGSTFIDLSANPMGLFFLPSLSPIAIPAPTFVPIPLMP
jgi:RHS repeat-associated protein